MRFNGNTAPVRNDDLVKSHLCHTNGLSKSSTHNDVNRFCMRPSEIDIGIFVHNLQGSSDNCRNINATIFP